MPRRSAVTSPFSALKHRYDAFADRALGSLSEIERRDVRAFDHWIARERGWIWFVAAVGATTFAAWVASLLPWNMSFVEAALVFNGVVLGLLWSGLSAWFGYRKVSRRTFRFALVAIVLALAAGVGGGTLVDLARGRDPMAFTFASAQLRHVVIAAIVFGVLYSLLIALITTLRNREYAALTAHLEAKRRQSELSRQLAESRLKMLQLQVEPHFLFNTLGSAQQLAEKGAPDAARLIADLIVFLRASTPSMRGDASTLAQEAALCGAYLAIMRTRLPRRLTYRIDIPPALAARTMPPGMLITLVENAIKHGIEPCAAGGHVNVTAAVESDGRLVVSVADTGVGLADAPGQGIGLANIRERLALLYTGRAHLALEANDPHGFIARIILPAAPGELAFAAAEASATVAPQ
jgi:signal transduction histidine kinase